MKHLRGTMFFSHQQDWDTTFKSFHIIRIASKATSEAFFLKISDITLFEQSEKHHFYKYFLVALCCIYLSHMRIDWRANRNRTPFLFPSKKPGFPTSIFPKPIQWQCWRWGTWWQWSGKIIKVNQWFSQHYMVIVCCSYLIGGSNPSETY